MHEFIRRLPKAELHCHLDGSLRAATLLELSLQAGFHVPAQTAPELAHWMRVDDARNLGDYLARFDVTLAVMQDAPSLERIAYELVCDAAAENVTYIEVRFCPALNTRGGLTLTDVMDAVLHGLARGERETGTWARVIVCALRSFPAQHSQEMAEVAVAYRGRGVVAFDLAGGELGNPARSHAGAFDYARQHDLSVTVHAGEGDGALSIREAVHRCATDRIGHGTRLCEDAALEAYVIDHQIALEVCPTSNVQTRVVATFADHPLLRYHRLGAMVTINTDNRMMSGVAMSDEYARCVQHLGFSHTDLVRVTRAAFTAAFLPFADKQHLLAAADEVMTNLVAGVSADDNVFTVQPMSAQ
jgi:adenosine deaminase